MTLLKKPGVSLLLAGLALFFVVRPIVDGIWVIGGLLGAFSFIVGLLGIVGGGYIFMRSMGKT